MQAAREGASFEGEGILSRLMIFERRGCLHQLENDTGVGPSPFSILPTGAVGGVLRSSPAHSSVWHHGIEAFFSFWGRPFTFRQ